MHSRYRAAETLLGYQSRMARIMAAWLTMASLLVMFAAAAEGAQDTDGDGVPDDFDNCIDLPNGFNDLSNQVDTDGDGFGNRCDPDLNQDGLIAGRDWSIFLSSLGTTDPLTDLDGDGVIAGGDINIFGSFLNRPPGPSGLACADATIDVNAGDSPCTL